jgi:hypothetical protein
MKIRIHIQSNVRQLIRAPGSIDSQTIEKERVTLTTLMGHLKQAQHAAGVMEIIGIPLTEKELLQGWDDVVYEPVTGPAPATTTNSQQAESTSSAPLPSSSSARLPSQNIGPVPIEEQILSLPSNGNVDSIHNELECMHRISLADHHLNQIRNLIAEKSFQFSHLIRVAPRKAVATRSRAAVTKLNQQIALHCQLYSKCRSRILALGADWDTLSRLNILSPSDIGASTAVVNPNEPGSSRIQLSWIWQTAGGHRFGLSSDGNIGADIISGAGDRIIECNCFISQYLIDSYYSLVRRIHWLRARAQYKRWQEEVTITRYEMQWTVAYFAYNGDKWEDRLDTSAGANAYANRKKTMWHQMALRADKAFRLLNNSYQSPL